MAGRNAEVAEQREVTGRHLLLLAFVWRQIRAAGPLLPPYIAKDRRRGGSFATLFLAGVGTVALLPTLMSYLAYIRGLSLTQATLAMLPAVAAALIGATQVSARLSHRVPARNLIVPGLVFSALGLLLLTRLKPDSGYVASTLPGMLLAGFGGGMALVPLFSLAMGGIAAQDFGAGAALTTRVHKVGEALGTALFGTVLFSAAAARMEADPKVPPDILELARNGQFVVAQGLKADVAKAVNTATLGGCTATLWWSVGFTPLAGLAAALLLRPTGPGSPRPIIPFPDQRDAR